MKILLATAAVGTFFLHRVWPAAFTVANPLVIFAILAVALFICVKAIVWTILAPSRFIRFALLSMVGIPLVFAAALGCFLGPELLAVLKTPLAASKGKDWLRYEKIPDIIKLALVIAEDRRFWERVLPFDFRSITRAAVENVKGCVLRKSGMQGASTITQLVARNCFALPVPKNHERSWKRKILEGFMAIRVTSNHTRAEQIELLLNRATFAGGQIGLRRASLYWFGREPTELNVHEAYSLIVSIRNPGKYSSETGLHEAAIWFIKTAARNGYIDGDPAAVQIVLRFRPQNERLASKRALAAALSARAIQDASSASVRDPLPQNSWPMSLRAPALKSLPADIRMRVEAEHLGIDGTFDFAFQSALQQLGSDHMARLEAAHPGFRLEYSVVVVNGETGAVLSLVQRAPEREFNFGVQSRRPAGSLEKPIITLAALASGVAESTLSTFRDSPIDGNWPRNCERAWSHKDVTLEFAIKESLNTVFADLFQKKAVTGELARIHQALGLPPVNPSDRSQALGTKEMTNLEIASAYAAIGANGRYIAPTLIRAVKDAKGTVVWQPERTVRQACERGHAGDVLKAMNAVFDGTGKRLPRELKRTGCVKTSTTSAESGGTRDLRCVYVHPGKFAVAIWVGCEKGALWNDAVSGRDLAPFSGSVFLESEKALGQK